MEAAFWATVHPIDSQYLMGSKVIISPSGRAFRKMTVLTGLRCWERRGTGIEGTQRGDPPGSGLALEESAVINDSRFGPWRYSNREIFFKCACTPSRYQAWGRAKQPNVYALERIRSILPHSSTIHRRPQSDLGRRSTAVWHTRPTFDPGTKKPGKGNFPCPVRQSD
jgi:hypothetical protein